MIAFTKAKELDELWHVLKLTEDEEDSIKTTGDTEENTNTDGKHWLVGKLLTTRPFNKDTMIGTMKVIWKLTRGVEIMALEDNLFLFKFLCGKDRDRILEGAPWSFDRHMLMFHDFVGDWRPEEYVFEKVAFWIKIYNLLLGMRTSATRETIGWRLGKLIKVDNGIENGG
ncbi:hypothetical protein PTKIN_Ptkin09bG0191200 [Pterospermum kingtungense]